MDKQLCLINPIVSISPIFHRYRYRHRVRFRSLPGIDTDPGSDPEFRLSNVKIACNTGEYLPEMSDFQPETSDLKKLRSN
jgi:hypothetical protein